MANRDSNSDPVSSNPNAANTSSPSGAGPVEQVKEQAKSLANEAKQQVSDVAGQARDHVEGLVAQQKERVAGQLGSLAGALRETVTKLDEKDGKGLGQYASRAADQVDRVSHYLRDKELGDVIRDAETFARRRPDVFLGGTFLAGLLLARFLKASGDNQGDMGTGNLGTGNRTAGNRNTGNRSTQLVPQTGQSFPQPGSRSYTAPRSYTPPAGG
jgi:hypothetical protein